MASEVGIPNVSMKSVGLGDVLDTLERVNPDLSGLLQALDPGKELPLVLATYRYGQKIMDQGRLSAEESDGIPPDALSTLQDTEEMFAVQLFNKSEQFYQVGDRVMPLQVIQPGDIFGLERAFGLQMGISKQPSWQITAGLRSVFMLPRITDGRSHKRLNISYGFSDKAPNNLSDHWSVFKYIDQGTSQKMPWHAQVLWFPKSWLQPRDDLAWMHLQNYLLRQAMRQSQQSQLRWGHNDMWDSFSNTVRVKNLKPNPYLMDTVKHLLGIAIGAVPGFQIMEHDETCMPLGLVQHAYLEIYQLKDYAPIIMRPTFLCKENMPVYYSLGYPSLLEGSPAIRKAPSVITELREIKMLMNNFLSILREQQYQYDGLNQLDVDFNYYHSEEDQFGEVSNSLDIVENDPMVKDCLSEYFPDKDFSIYGQFLRGCIQISKAA